jgi:hypothetical protein
MISFISKLIRYLNLRVLRIDNRFSRKNSLNELQWANIFRDSIKGQREIETLSLNIGRWAGGYQFFYILNRVLTEFKPKSILEFGLGESSKLISTHLESYLPTSHHHIIEHSTDWSNFFNSRFILSKRSKIEHLDLVITKINGFNVHSYKDFQEKIKNNYDLYVVDGPFGSSGFSRFDIVSVVNHFQQDERFIILFDDTNRYGERDTVGVIRETLDLKKIKYFISSYSGLKETTVICSEEFRFSTSL